MTGLVLDEPRRLPGTLITLDGPGGVGKSTTARLVAETLTTAGVPVHATSQPSRAPLGELARHGTDTYHAGRPPRWTSPPTRPRRSPWRSCPSSTRS